MNEIARYALLIVSAALLAFCAFILLRARKIWRRVWRLVLPVALWSVFAGSFAAFRLFATQPFDVQLLNLWSAGVHVYAGFVIAILLYACLPRNGIGGGH